MTGAAQKIFAVAAALMLAFGILTMPHLNSAFAQNEAEPEATPMEEPQAEPTEFTPVTAGEAERGVPAPSPQAATSPVTEGTPALSPAIAETTTAAETPSPAETPSATPASIIETPAATSSPAERRSTISRESLRRGSRTPRKKIAESQTPNATPSGSSTPARTAPNAGKGTAIVPENSPFAGMNFGSQKGPTNIKSDSATLDYQNKAILFSGHVHAVQAGGDLTSDTLKVQYGKDFNDIKMTYADGNVRMSQGTRWITSDHAVLDQGKHLLKFLGNPVVHDGEDQITGSMITVDLVSGKSTVENPRVVIFPRESKNPDNVDAPGSP